MKTRTRLMLLLALISPLAHVPNAFGEIGCSFISRLYSGSPVCPDFGDPPPCPDCCPRPGGGPGPAPSNGPSGGGCGGCAAGMPIWWVSEPYINLRLEDEPLGYNPSHGPRVSFTLSYRQRGVVKEEPEIFGVGTNWSVSFRAYLAPITSTLIRVHKGGAGAIDYIPGEANYQDGSILTTSDSGLTYQIDT